MSYETLELSAQQGAHVELYEIQVGGLPGAPTVSEEGIIFRDRFDQYADDAELAAAYSFAANDFTGAAMHLDETGGIGGSKCMRIDVPAATFGGHIGAIATRDIGSLTPSVGYVLRGRARLDPGFLTDVGWANYHLGLGQSGGTITDFGDPPTDAWVTLVNEDVARFSSFTVWRAVLGWGVLSFFTVGHAASVFFDNLVLQTAASFNSGGGGTPTIYRFTSADVDIVYNGNTYLHLIGHRNNLKDGGLEAEGGNLELTIPRDHELVGLTAGPPNPPVSVRMIRLHRGDLTDPRFPWLGQVARRDFSGPGCTLICEGPETLMERKLPRRLTQKATCHHFVGDELCQVVLEDFTSDPLNVSAIGSNGLQVTVDGAAAAAGTWTNKWQHGVLVAPDGALGKIEFFSSLAAGPDVVTLKQALPTLEVGQQVKLIAGDDNTPSSCARFGNLRNYGGERLLPVKSPGGPTGIGSSGGGA